MNRAAKSPHLLRESLETLPFFALETILAERKLLARVRRFLAWLTTLGGVITLILVIFVALIGVNSLLAYSYGWSSIRDAVITVGGFVIVPLYATWSALSAGTGTFGEHIGSGTAAEMVLAGYRAERVGAEIILARLYRHLPAALLFAALAIVAVGADYWQNPGEMGAFPIFSLAFGAAALLYQAYVLLLSAWLGCLVESVAAKYFLAIGAFIVNSVLPIVASALIIEKAEVYSEKLMEVATLVFTPFGAIFYSLGISGPGAMGLSVPAPLGFFVCAAGQAALSYWLFRLAVGRFRRRVMS